MREYVGDSMSISKCIEFGAQIAPRQDSYFLIVQQTLISFHQNVIVSGLYLMMISGDLRSVSLEDLTAFFIEIVLDKI
jgi:hypothetical protein